MAQSPFLVDQIQVAPGVAGTRLINSSIDGGLQFQDASVASVLLSALVGTRNITGVFIVGRAGDGAAYTSIQGAFDAIPDSSSSLAPSLVLVYPGVYSENLTLQKDGVSVQGVGDVTLQNVGDSDTLTISASLDATPKAVSLRGVKVLNGAANRSCVSVSGADSFASGSLTVTAAPLTAGDEIVIGGVTLTGIAGTRTPGSNNFNVLGSSVSAVAAEISAAINDPANSFYTVVRATPVLGLIGIEAKTAGSDGNLISLATTSANVTLSGVFLTGGGSAGSLVLSEGLRVDACDLVASGPAGYQSSASTCGPISVTGGSWRGSDNSSLVSVSNCTRFLVSGVDWANDIELAYDTGSDQPFDNSCEYGLSQIGRIGGVLCNLVGEGSFSVTGCPSFATGIQQTGDRSLNVSGSRVGGLVLGGTTEAVLSGSVRDSVSVSGGTPTLAESRILDSVSFTAPEVSKAYTFDVTQPDANYAVTLESPTTSTTLAVTNKTSSGFDVEASATFTGTVSLVISRDM